MTIVVYKSEDSMVITTVDDEAATLDQYGGLLSSKLFTRVVLTEPNFQITFGVNVRTYGLDTI